MRPFSRRTLLRGLLAFGATGLAAPAVAQTRPDAASLGLLPNSADDQSPALQAAVDLCAALGQPLFLPAGTYLVANIRVPSGLVLQGIPGGSILTLAATGSILIADEVRSATIEDLKFDGLAAMSENGLIGIRSSTQIRLSGLEMSGSTTNLIGIDDSEAEITGCSLYGADNNAIFAMNSRGLLIRGNRISGSGNGGIRIWRSESGEDGSIISDNIIKSTGSIGGGNGQNGNGINVFRANSVIIANNHISESSFSAVRLNATNNSHITGNACLGSGECAIFSEFGFSGSIIANNTIDGAATGISMTNFNEGGRLAVCTGNIVRNITPTSLVNPDTNPVGIFAEADTAVTGNVVEAVPGIGIGAGYGPYLRNVLVSDNVVRDVEAGIVVSVAPDAGSARIAGNLISDARRYAIGGAAWDEVLSADLIADAAKYPQLSIEGNTIS